MSTTFCRSIVVGLLGLGLSSATAIDAQTLQPPASGAQNPTPPSAAAPATAIIRGRVLAGDNGQPIRRASVHLFSTEPPVNGQFENRTTSTDAEGLYEFRELPAGRYTVNATKGAYVGVAFGQSTPRDTPKPIDLLAGQVLQRVDISLPRGGVVSGRIIDEFGEPLSNAQVTAVMPQGGRMLPSGRTATTNDLGEFRLYGLMPGQYYVRASVRSQSGPTQDPDHVGYATTYFPGVVDETGARRVTVAATQAIAEMVFAMVPVKTATVTGHIVDSHGKAFAGMLTLVPTAGIMGPSMNGAAVRPDGTFTFANVLPGDYLLRAQSRGNADAEAATTTLTVAGVDISGVELVGAPASTATGRLVADSGTLQALAGATLTIYAVATTPGLMMGGLQPARIGDDLTFAVKSFPGVMNLRVTGLPSSVGVHAIRMGGVDVSDTGVEFRSGADLKDLEIELTNRLSTVTGLATDSRGDPAKDYTAIVFSRNAEQWKPESRYLRLGRADGDGRFKIVGLPPGDYYAVALTQVDSISWNSADTLEPLRSQATMFSLDDGETKTLDLKVVAASRD